MLAAAGVALMIVTALGLLNLQYPFVADQTMAFFAAKTVAGGGTLYVDFWDNKLPGLVWFYAAAGALFGFDEIGVHLLELLWMLVFALVLMVTLAREFTVRWAVAGVPVAVIGTYYAASDPFHLTQLEMLVALPVYLSAWLATRTPSAARPLALMQFLSGVCAGVTVTFKIVFAPLFVLFWLVAWYYLWRAGLRDWRRMALCLLAPVSAGVALVIGLVAGWFWYEGALWELYWTAFVYPPAALAAAPPASVLRLFGSVMFFASYFLAWALFIVVGIADWWYGRRDPLSALLIAWLVAGLGLILIQRFSWWQYHFLFLFTPAGILGVRGCAAIPARLLVRAQLSRLQAHALTLLLLFAPCTTLAVSTGQKISAYIEVILFKNGDGDDLRRFVNRRYAEIEHSVRFLKQDTARPGRIYVFGDPLYYLLSGRDPALPIMGWPWEYFLDSQWVHLPRQLAHMRPPYIYVDRENRRHMELRGGGVLDFLLRDYVPFSNDTRGTWYQIHPDRLAPGS